MTRTRSMLCGLSAGLLLTLSLSLSLTAAVEKNAAFDDPAKAAAEDPDFAIQGEYLGEHDTDNGRQKLGVQVIAQGDGNFHGVGYNGGLPGDGWDGKEKPEADGKLKDGVVTFEKDGAKGVLKNGVFTIINADGQTVATLKKVHRQSPTLGAKPPKGAVVLFDGTKASLDNWQGARMTEDGLLMQGVTSKRKFADQTLHVEFRIPYQPFARGQGRGNSGLYLQGRYEVQMLDSFGLAGKNNECGGIYSIKEPDVNMAFPPLTWQTYDVEYTAARYNVAGEKVTNAKMTVRHNGIVIHRNVDVPHTTTAAPVKEGREPGPVYLQNHGNPVRYRNIWLVERK